MKKILAVSLCVFMVAMLAACGGASEADNAYDAWTNNQLPAMQQATADLETNAAEVSGDAQATYDLISEYYSVVSAITQELESIDTSQLSSERKTGAEEQLASLHASLQSLEDQLATVEQMLE